MDKSLAEKLAGWRRHLHANPELSLQETKTAAFVCEKLKELQIPFVAGVGGNGVVATLSRGNSNRSVGLRADMDALPITETTGLPYASTNPGVMHACGHDGHTTSLLGAAALLAQDSSWTGTVHLVFQPAEEGGGGARSMIADGLFQRFPMESIFGYHNWPGLDAGTVMVHDGPVMAGGGRIEIIMDGHAGHAAMPHLSRDPMVAAGHLLVALQTIVARNVDPLDTAVITIGTIEGGKAANQIPASVTLRGTQRFYRDEVRDLLTESIKRVANGIAATFGMTARVNVIVGIGPTVNHKAEAAMAVEACKENALPVRTDLLPAMTGEDFSWYLREKPGAFVWIGNGPAEPGRELHNDAYNFNDAILPNAAGFLAGVARRALRA
ncbi:MAG: amidohydrolase [Rhodospirillales bacterium 70-18]|nr:amidohydrolase [Rhodospirillales bacterium]OJY64139.1 MAG: amidohydrolase [Rhodospirillales bacterium 70-18]